MDLELHPLSTAHIVTFGNRVMNVLMFPYRGSQGELESHPGSGVGSVSTLSHLTNHLIFFSGSWGEGTPLLVVLSHHIVVSPWKTAFGTCFTLGDFMDVCD